jgi:hypothetical protein
MENGEPGKLPPLQRMTRGEDLSKFKPYFSNFFKDIVLYSTTQDKNKDLRFYNVFDKRLDGYEVLCTQSQNYLFSQGFNVYTTKLRSKGFLYDCETVVQLEAKPTKDEWYDEKDIDTHKLSDVNIQKVVFEKTIWHPKAVSVAAVSLFMFGFAVYSYYKGSSMKIGA